MVFVFVVITLYMKKGVIALFICKPPKNQGLKGIFNNK